MRIIPPVDYIDTTSSAERQVAELLDRIPVEATDAAVAYHSVHLPRHRRQIMGEADFVLLWKGAILVLEVKGGRIGRTSDGIWYSRDRQDRVHNLTKSPWVQANEAAFSLIDILRSRIPTGNWPFASAVITPHQTLDPDPEWEPEQHIGLDRMTPEGLQRSLDALARFARRPRGTQATRSGNRLRDRADLREVSKLLRGEVDAMRTVPDDEVLIDQNIVTMTDEQVEAMRIFETNPRVLVLGGAGTGKTVLAAEAARRASSDGNSVAFVCGSSAVLDWASQLLDDSPVRIVPFVSIPEEPEFDVVVVDEGQDLLNVEDMARLSESLRGGLDRGRWWIFFDPNNQAHLTGAFEATVRDEIQGSAVVGTLTKNVRNARAVVTTVQAHLGADLGSPQIGEGPTASVKKARSDEEVRSLLDHRIEQLRRQEVDRRKITIVSAASDEAKSVLADRGRLPSTYSVDGNSYEVVTAGAVKGLERHHVIVIDVVDLESERSRAGAYVAMTRPRYSLHVICSPEAYRRMTESAREFVTQQSTQRGAGND